MFIRGTFSSRLLAVKGSRPSLTRGSAADLLRTIIQSRVAFSGAGEANVTVKPSGPLSEMARFESHDCSMKTA